MSSVFWALFCDYCKTHEIGRVYVSTPKDMLEMQCVFLPLLSFSH